MEHEQEARIGRPPLAQTAGKNRNIRLTDAEWKAFCDKLGPAWLRNQIKLAESAK